MYHKKIDDDIRCPLEYGINLLGGKWKSRIVCLLGNIGPLRFGELKTELVNVTDGVLASTLNTLISDELIEKCEVEELSQVIYTITDKGKSLIPILQELCRWSGPYFSKNNDTIMGHCRQCEFYKTWSRDINEEKISESDSCADSGMQSNKYIRR